jgi:hypothetical protein
MLRLSISATTRTRAVFSPICDRLLRARPGEFFSLVAEFHAPYSLGTLHRESNSSADEALPTEARVIGKAA